MKEQKYKYYARKEKENDKKLKASRAKKSGTISYVKGKRLKTPSGIHKGTKVMRLF